MRLAAAEAVLAALVVALAVPACRSRGEERLVIGAPRLAGLGLLYIADVEGYFAARGVSVERRDFDSGKDALAALERGEVDVAAALETPVVLRAPFVPRLEILTTLDESTGNTRLVGRRSRGVHRDRDLGGKRIGVPAGTNAEYFVHAMLAFAGVPDASVALVDTPPRALAAALASGDVDAVAVWSPWAEEAARGVGGDAIELGSEVYAEMSVLLTRNEVRAARRPALVKALRALADAERLVRERPDAAFAALRRALPERDEADLRAQWGRARPGLGISNLLLTVLEREGEFFRATGRLEDTVPADELVVTDLLSEVDYEAVTFVPMHGELR